VTLVLGAGVSLARGVPSWSELAGRTGRRATGEPLTAPAHPFGLQFAFELAADALEARAGQGGARAPSFAGVLREAIYARAGAPRGQDTLSTLAAVVRRDRARREPRVRRLITFNVDDLLEREVHGGRAWKARPLVWPVSRESHSPRRAPRSPVPVYHIHGFLPRWPDSYPDAPDTLVFTDAQYWRTVAQPASFANRVVAHSLHDSCCIFVGLSMTDVNLIRWLGLRAIAVEVDRASQYAGDPERIRASTRHALHRHFWVRPDSDDPTGLVSALLDRRGVASVPIDGWASPSFRRLLLAAFATR